MTKVYLVKQHGGEYEDKWEMITHAFFDQEKAEEIKANADLERNNAQSEMDSLFKHVENCEHYDVERDDDDVCEKCDRFYHLQDILEDNIHHFVEEIEVE